MMKHLKKTITAIVFSSLFTLSSNAQTTDVVLNLDNPISMARNGNDLYFVNNLDKTVQKIDITNNLPTTPSVIFTSVITLLEISISGNDMYISRQSDIIKIDYTSATPTFTAIISNLEGLTDIIVSGNELYYSEGVDFQSGNGKISKIDITSQNPTPVIVASNLTIPIGLTLNNNELYFSQFNSGKLSKLDITSTFPATVTDVIINFVENPIGSDILGDNLYVIDGSKVVTIDLTTTLPATPSDVLTGLDNPRDLLFINNELYITEGGLNLLPNEGKVLKHMLPSLGVNPFEKSDKFMLYPNPVENLVKVSNIKKDTKYEIINILGKTIKTGVINSKSQSIETKDLNTGMYSILIGNKSYKIIKK